MAIQVNDVVTVSAAFGRVEEELSVVRVVNQERIMVVDKNGVKYRAVLREGVWQVLNIVED